MAMIYELDGVAPQIDASCFLAPDAVVVGAVTVAAEASIWFGVVVRADTEQITIGMGSNVQENAVLHADPGFPLHIGERVTVGHKAMLHGCSIGEGSLVGIDAVVLNGAVIGRNCLIGANALVTEGMRVPDGSLVLGSPARVRRSLSDEERARLEESARRYRAKGQLFRVRLRRIVDETDVARNSGA